MTITEQEFDVTAPTLFDAITNPYSYPNWLVGTRRIRGVSSNWPQPTSYFKHTVGFGPLAIPDRTTVRAIEEPRMVEMLVRARPAIEAVVRFEIAPSRLGCTLRMEETPVGVYKILSALAGPLIRLRNERSLQRLRSMLDTDPYPRSTLRHTQDDATHRTGERQALENAENESPA